MKITIACKYYSPRGGAQTFLRNFVEHLAADGHQVRIIALEVQDASEGVAVHVARPRGLSKGLRALRFAREVSRLLKADDCDLSFSEQRMFGADVVRPGGGVHKEHLRLIPMSYPNTVLRALKAVAMRISPKEHADYVIERRLYRDPALRCLIANSKLLRDHLVKHYPHLKDRVHVVYNGADCQRFSPSLKSHHARVRAELQIPADALVGAFVSHNFRRKGLAAVLQALAILKRKRTQRPVHVIAVGREKGWGPRLARHLGVEDCVRFTGPQTPDRYYGASDFLALPTFYDPCANVTVEGLACGLPAITSIYNGAYEMLTAGVNGFYMRDPSDAAQLAGFIEHYMDAEKLAAASAAARELALQYTFDHQYRRLMDVLAPVAAQKAKESTDRLAEKYTEAGTSLTGNSEEP